jgi:eukaryotic-like serine/threonine-protein kinase
MKYCPICDQSYPDNLDVCDVDGATLRFKSGKQDSLIGKVIKGRYRVIQKLGEGGMGTVYLAEQVAVSRKVALKWLHSDYARDEEFVRRFRQEAKLAAALNHRNVVTIFDFDQADDDSLYIVMEYVDGTNLADVLREGPIEIRRALRMAVQIAEGLAAAHRAGVIHRDVKPENVMVVGREEDIKLMDFGISRLRDTGGASRLTRSGTIMGTPAYMAPEQIEGGEVSERTDIYAFRHRAL